MLSARELLDTDISVCYCASEIDTQEMLESLTMRKLFGEVDTRLEVGEVGRQRSR